MTKQEVKKLKVGSEYIDCIGSHKVVTEIRYHGDVPLYQVKWLNDNGTLSKGCEYLVPCQFNKWDKVVKF